MSEDCGMPSIKGRAEMTLAEQWEALIDAIGRARFTITDWDSAPPQIKENMRYNAEQTLAAISAAGSAAGFAIVGTEVTDEMRELSAKMEDGPYCGVDEWWARMLAAGAIPRKPE